MVKVVNRSSPKATTDGNYESKVEAQKKMVEEIKVQWKLLWSERFNDKALAEGVSINDYEILDVKRGTIIHATRDFKALNFKEILEHQTIENPDRFIQPNVHVGGWNKFIKKEITSQKSQRNKTPASNITERLPQKKSAQQQKKHGRGWLHNV